MWLRYVYACITVRVLCARCGACFLARHTPCVASYCRGPVRSSRRRWSQSATCSHVLSFVHFSRVFLCALYAFFNIINSLTSSAVPSSSRLFFGNNSDLKFPGVFFFFSSLPLLCWLDLIFGNCIRPCTTVNSRLPQNTEQKTKREKENENENFRQLWIAEHAHIARASSNILSDVKLRMLSFRTFVQHQPYYP